jgi:peptidoglycan-associated lipoprotein
MVRYTLLILLLSVALIFTACAKKETTPVVEEVEPVEEVTPPLIEEEPEEAVEIEEAEPIVLEDIFFDYDKFNIKDEYKADAKLLVEGHCDERGTNEYNLSLGEKRAKAVIDFYVTYGVDASRLSMISYGEEKPFAMGSDEKSWAKNRRAHMVVE